MKDVSGKTILLVASLLLAHTSFAEVGGTGYDGGDIRQEAIPNAGDVAISRDQIEEIFRRCLFSGSPIANRPSLMQKLYRMIYGKRLWPSRIRYSFGQLSGLSGQNVSETKSIQSSGPVYDVMLYYYGPWALFKSPDASPLPDEYRGYEHHFSKFDLRPDPGALAVAGKYVDSAGVGRLQLSLFGVPNAGQLTTVQSGYSELGHIIAQVNEEAGFDEWGNQIEGAPYLSNFRLRVPDRLMLENRLTGKKLKEIDLTDYKQCLQNELVAATNRPPKN